MILEERVHTLLLWAFLLRSHSDASDCTLCTRACVTGGKAVQDDVRTAGRWHCNGERGRVLETGDGAVLT